MATKTTELQEQLTTRFIEGLSTGEPATWRKPWVAAFAEGAPLNATTGAYYRGGNSWWFVSEQYLNDEFVPGWATYKQWAAVGCQVQKGQKGTYGVKWLPKKPCQPGEHRCTKCAGMFPSTFVVFNAAQTDLGVEYYNLRSKRAELTAPERLAHIEEFVANTGADIRHTLGDRAYYSPLGDYINLPEQRQFRTTEGYYGTALHELTHWTGHRNRCNRDLKGYNADPDSYAFEELVAELGAVFLCATHGIEIPDRSDHEAYLGSWLKQLKAAPSILWKAATAASAATDHLHSLQPAPAAAEEELVAA